MKRLSIMVLIAGLVAAGCAGKSSGSLGPAPTGSSPSPTESPTATPSVTATGTPTVTPAPTGQPFTFEVWFLRDSKLFVTTRTEPFQPSVAGLALDALGAGPTGPEVSAGVRTAVPPGSSAGVTSLSNGLAIVDLALAGIGGSSTMAEERLPIAQVVYTLTQYSTISKVRLGNGGPTYSRKSFEDLLPAILVEHPLVGQRLSSPVTISGTANVFEATVSIRILDQDGHELANTFTTASCGTGCRGDYSIAVSYAVDHEQTGTIEVFESSAKDGSPINVQSIPVTLTP